MISVPAATTPAPATGPFLPNLAPSSGRTGSSVDAAMISAVIAIDCVSGTASHTVSRSRTPIIAAGQAYESNPAAQNGIDSVKRNASDAMVDDQTA